MFSRDPQVVADTVAAFADVVGEHYGIKVTHANGSSSFFIGSAKRGEGVLVGVNLSRSRVVVSVLLPGAELARFFYSEYCQVPDLAAVVEFIDSTIQNVMASAEYLAHAIADHYGTTARASEHDGSVWFVEDLYGGETDNLCTVFVQGGYLCLIANVCSNTSQNGFTLDKAVHFIDSAYGVGGAAGVIFEHLVPVSVCVRGGSVQWANTEVHGALVCITDAVTGNELHGDIYDVTLSAYCDVVDSRLSDVVLA
jgi:hypothetical protein